MSQEPVSIKAIAERLQCVGAFGYGGGWAVGRGLVAHSSGQIVCSTRCPIKAECWEKHRRRVRSLFPAIVEAFEQTLAEHGGDGKAALVAWVESGRQQPEISMTLGNLDDGIRAGRGLPHFDRGAYSLVLPIVEPARDLE